MGLCRDKSILVVSDTLCAMKLFRDNFIAHGARFRVRLRLQTTSVRFLPRRIREVSVPV